MKEFFETALLVVFVIFIVLAYKAFHGGFTYSINNQSYTIKVN